MFDLCHMIMYVTMATIQKLKYITSIITMQILYM